MLKRYNPKEYHEIREVLTKLESTLAMLKVMKAKPSPKTEGEFFRGNFQDSLLKLEGYCSRLGLTDIQKSVEDITNSIPTADLGVLQGNITLILNQIERKFQERLFFYLVPEDGQLYETANAFGNSESTVFPEINYDVEHMAKCLAVGEYTASVFHAMKVLEKTLQIFAAQIGAAVDMEKDGWNAVTRNINTALAPKDPHDPFVKECHAVNSHLNSVRIACRNEVMHPKQQYDYFEAYEVFRSVSTLVSHVNKLKNFKNEK